MDLILFDRFLWIYYLFEGSNFKYLFFYSSESFYALALADTFPPEFEWEQVYSSFLDFSHYSNWS